MTPSERTEAKSYLWNLATATELVSAQGIHKRLGIKQPFALWVSRRLTWHKSPDDYIKVGKDFFVSPPLALALACGGGSPFSARCQVIQIEALTQAIGDRNPLEVINTAIKCVQAEELLSRSFDPEREVNQ